MKAASDAPDAVSSPTLTETLRAKIEQSIYDGELQLGEAISDKRLCERYQASRTPVREALLQLAAQGLIDVVPRSGMFVAKAGLKELASLLEVFTQMEGVAASLAARRMTGEQRRLLAETQATNQHYVDAVDAAAYRQGNAEFHEIIYHGCANEVLANQIRSLRKRMSLYRRDVFDNPARIAQSHQEHLDIMKAIVAGEEEASRQAVLRHHASGGQALTDLMMLAN